MVCSYHYEGSLRPELGGDVYCAVQGYRLQVEHELDSLPVLCPMAYEHVLRDLVSHCTRVVGSENGPGVSIMRRDSSGRGISLPTPLSSRPTACAPRLSRRPTAVRHTP